MMPWPHYCCVVLTDKLVNLGQRVMQVLSRGHVIY